MLKFSVPKLKAAMEKEGIKAPILAKRINVNYTTIFKLLHGHRYRPCCRVMEGIFTYFTAKGYPIDYFFEREEKASGE